MAFIFLSTDALDQRFRSTAAQTGGNNSPSNFNGLAPIRRPYRGIQIKDDTYATISIFRANGTNIPLLSSSGFVEDVVGDRGFVAEYGDFIMTSISDQRQEKQQILETFGDSFIFFFGERPRVVTFEGLLMNTEDFNWRSQFWENYNRYMRGTRLVQQNARVFLSYDTIVIEGYPIEAQAFESANDPYSIKLRMSMFLTNYQDFSAIGRVFLPDDVEADFRGVDVLNRELEDRARLATASAEVRLRNFQSSRGGISGFIREAAKLASNNAITNLTDGIRDIASFLISGRVITVPEGVAGFYAQIGRQGLVAQGSVDPTLEGILAFQGSQVKLTVPRGSRFVGSQKLRVPIFENVDEYPLVDASLPVIPFLLNGQIAKRIAERDFARRVENESLNILNARTSATNEVLRSIGDVIQFARSGFALVKNTEAFLRDPDATTLASLGLSGTLDF